jgi:hypothetical protein
MFGDDPRLMLIAMAVFIAAIIFFAFMTAGN